MANNRLYLYNPENNSCVFLAKSFGDGWFVQSDIEKTLAANLDAFFSGGTDVGSSTECDFDASITGGPTTLQLKTEADLPADVSYIYADRIIRPTPAA